MRMLASRYQQPKAAKVKQRASAIKHISAPLKGLSLNSKLVPGDPLTASVLTNFVVDDDRVSARAGFQKRMTTAAQAPIWHLIPYYGIPTRLAAATNHTLVDAITGALLKDGFGSNDWHWTSFSNLSENDYTVMVNGADGVWSWDGGSTPDPLPVGVVNLSNSDPAVCTVSPTDIGKFKNGMAVVIAGATDSGMTVANGTHVIGSVGSPANTFTLIGVDTSTAAAPQTIGVTADAPGSIAKELVTAPATDPWVVPDEFQIVLSHMNRLWFADSANLAVYYLPLQQKSGEVHVLPLNAIFRKGGSIRALATWTLDGGRGMEDQLAIFTSNGEVAIYQGTDPDQADTGQFNLTGIFRFDAPMSKHCVINYGGDLYVLISTGLTPMTTMLRAETEQLGQLDKSVISLFLAGSTKYRDRPGWQVFMNPSSSRVFCNIPLGSSNRYTQMIRHMPRPVWSQFENIPARCFGWIEPNVYFGDDSGSVYEMHPRFLSDDGKPIYVDMQTAWSAFNTPAAKQWKMVLPYIITDGVPKPYVDIRVDYDMSPPANQPDVTDAQSGAIWDVAAWNEEFWAHANQTRNNWSGVGAIGRVGGVRLSAAVLNCEFSVAGFDVIYETGSLFG